jgi:type I restriction enzyme S subunit
MDLETFKDNFALLADTPNAISKLRELILQLAVMGKLVPQDPNDEPASELLRKIAVEKDRLVKEGKIRRSNPLPPVRPDEMPYELPKGWEWSRLANVALKLTDGTHHSPTNEPQGDFMYITAKNIKPNGIDLSDITYVTGKTHDEIYSRCDPAYGDILYIKDGATTGIVTINDIQEQFSLLSSVALIKLPHITLNRYILSVMRSPFFYENVRGDMAGIAITRVTLTKLSNTLVPLPPLAEQQRIVAKVDQLMALCDELESKLKRSVAVGEKLMEAAVHKALSY